MPINSMLKVKIARSAILFQHGGATMFDTFSALLEPAQSCQGAAEKGWQHGSAEAVTLAFPQARSGKAQTLAAGTAMS